MFNNRVSGPLGLVASIIIAIGLVSYSVVVAGFPGDPTQPAGDPVVQSNADERIYTIDYVEGQLVVKLESVDPTPIDEINALYGTSTIHYLPCLGVHLLAAEGRDADDMEALAEAVLSHPGVVDAHPNFLVVPMEPVQGSFAFPDESSEGTYIDQPAASTLRLPETHAIATGANVKVAVIDGGIEYTHPAFDGKVVSAYDYVDHDYDAFDEPGGKASGHGTFVAGVIHLIAPDAEIRSYRVNDPDGASNGYLVAEAIMQAVGEGCQVVNLSLVTADIHGAIASALEYATSKNVIVVAAAGNDFGQSALYPACDPSVITVAAVDDDNVLADFSCYGEHIDVCAPGVDIYAPYRDGGYAWWSGTSFSAPFAAGQAALIIEMNSDFYTNLWIKDAIIETADDLTGENPDLSGMLGTGMIDPYEAVYYTPPSGSYMSVIYPDYHEVFVQSDSVYSFYFHVLSEPYGIPYTITHYNQPSFLIINEPAGYTQGESKMTIDATGLAVGIYQDTVLCEVNGCMDSPKMSVITLNVVGDAIICHREDESVMVPAYSGKVDTSYLLIESTNAPAQYSVSLTGPSAFLSLITTSGNTRNIKYDPAAAAQLDTAYFTVDAGSLAPGRYYDTLEVTVDGIQNANPSLVLIQLEVFDEGTTYWNVYPRCQYLDFEEGDDTLYTGSISLTSENAPCEYYIYIPGMEYWDPDPIVLDHETGFTNDVITFTLDPTLFSANDNGYGLLLWIYSVENGNNTIAATAYVKFRIWEPEGLPAPQVFVDPKLDQLLSGVSNYPNPFNPDTKISFSLAEAAQVTLSVYNVIGQKIITLQDGMLPTGSHSVWWDGKDSQGNSVASGIYVYRLQADDATQTRKMILLK